MADTYSIAEAQANLPKLCRSKRPFVIRRRDKPVIVALPMEQWQAIEETLDLLGNGKFLKLLEADQAGKITYKELDLEDEDFGLRAS